MPNQKDRRVLVRRRRTAPEDGDSIAKEKSEAQEQRSVNQTAIHPIDTLLIQQLENILDGEKALRARYRSLGNTDNTPEIRMAFSKELSDLKERADRLDRFVSAMDYYGSLGAQNNSSRPSAAI